MSKDYTELITYFVQARPKTRQLPMPRPTKRARASAENGKRMGEGSSAKRVRMDKNETMLAAGKEVNILFYFKLFPPFTPEYNSRMRTPLLLNILHKENQRS
jgi:hypothetical protein